MSELQEKLALAIADAETAFENGELEKGEEKTQEATRWQKALQGLEQLQTFKAAAPEPMRPSLPGLPDNEPTPKPENGFAKALYVKRFGDTSDFIKAMLTEVHGADYEAQYWKHRQTFFKYIRGGDEVLSREERKLLRTPILTPNAIMDGLMQGVDVGKAFKATLVEGQDSLGGFLVPVDFQREIISRLPGLTVVRPRARTMTTSRDAVEYPKLLGGGSQYRSAVRITWVDETPTAGVAETNPTFSFERIPIHTAMAETWLSKNMLEDTYFNIEPYLTELFTEAIAMDEDNLFLTGDGVGKPQGILPNSANGLSLTEVDSGSAATIADWDKIKEVTYSIDAQYRQRAVWIAEKATYLKISQLVDGVSQYLWKQDQQQGQPRRLEGYEVLEQEGMPSLGTNLFPIIFGDLRGYTIADRIGMSVTRYDDSATARTNRVVVVLRRRLGGQVTETWRFVVMQCAA